MEITSPQENSPQEENQNEDYNKDVSRMSESEKVPPKKNLKYKENIFNESQDRGYVDWRRVRSAIEHENTLVHYRLSWFSSLQAFLFAAFGAIFGFVLKDPDLIFKDPSEALEPSEFNYLLIALIITFVIIFLGVFTSAAILRSLLAAKQQIRNLDCWWHEHEDDRSRLANENYWSRLTKYYQEESVRVKN